MALVEKNTVGAFSGIDRNAYKVACGYVNKFKKTKKSHILEISNFVYEGEKALIKGELNEFGKLLNETWIVKKSLSRSISNPVIDEIYDFAIQNGALGGKLLGAGGGGFLLFYVPYSRQKNILKHFRKLITVPFNFTKDGSTIMFKNVDNKII